MRAAVVVVGDELLTGHTEDANGPFLARRLREAGHTLRRITVVPDEEDEIEDALRRAAKEAELVFVCGGLGPTSDDVTADAVASFLHRPLSRPEEAKEQLRRIYRKGKEAGYLETDEVDEGAWRMARVPEGGTVVRNDEGAAPGSVHTIPDRKRAGTIYVLPGPPAELQSVFHHIQRRDLLPEGAPDAEVEIELDTFEAPVSGTLDEFDRAHPEVALGSYPQHGEKRVVVRLRGAPEDVRKAREDLLDELDEIVITADEV